MRKTNSLKAQKFTWLFCILYIAQICFTIYKATKIIRVSATIGGVTPLRYREYFILEQMREIRRRTR